MYSIVNISVHDIGVILLLLLRYAMSFTKFIRVLRTTVKIHKLILARRAYDIIAAVYRYYYCLKSILSVGKHVDEPKPYARL